MVGRSVPHAYAPTLAIHTDCGSKAPSGHDSTTHPSRDVYARPRTASLGSADDDEPVLTHLSASSAANTDISSSSALSANSTARTSTMTDDDRPRAANRAPTSPHAHPALTVLELVSNSASASALPDAFDFNVSRKGNFVAVYSSSNIWLIKSTQLPRLWARTLQVKRKPVAMDMTEDGFLLAVLSRPSQLDVYEIHGEQDRQIKKRRTISLVHEASSVAISPDGLIMITGNKFGIEVVAIAPNAPETAHRTLTGPVGDTLEFSDDGRTLLITSYARKSAHSSLYVLPGLFDGPLNEEGVPIPESPDTLWTGSMLFPETAKIARQATLLPDSDTGHVNELFAFNSQEDTWGVYDIATQRFTQRKMFLPDQQRWTRSEFVDDAMPAISPNADLAAVSLRMRGTTSIWIYQVPEWDFQSTTKSDLSPIQPCFCIPIVSDGPDTYQEICVLRWVAVNSQVQRLIAVGNSSTASADEAPGASTGSKGIIIVLDFDKSRPVGSAVPRPTKTEYDLDPLCPGEMLPEGSIDFEREVELVRTRTLAQRRAQDANVSDSRRNSRIGSTPVRARTSANRERPTSIRRPTDEDELTAEEAQAAFEMPYDNQQPRSQMSLARAATVAAVSPANRRHLRALPFQPLEYRRADGMREMPHESDADNWVPPPPAYTATAEASQSVSLSHPNGVSVSPSSRANAAPAIPPVPTLPANLTRFTPSAAPSHPYHSRGATQSQSSTDLPSTRTVSPTFVTPPQQRRPSLMHPTTFPSPERSNSSRRRNSNANRVPQPQAVPQVPRVPSQHRSAYSATSSHYHSEPQRNPRPNLRARRAVESTVNIRPPPVVDPASGRRGSEPAVSISRRPVPAGASPNRVSMPPPNARRNMLPRLATENNAIQHPNVGPQSAPPGVDRRQMRAPSRLNLRGNSAERTSSPKQKKKINCVVM